MHINAHTIITSSGVLIAGIVRTEAEKKAFGQLWAPADGRARASGSEFLYTSHKVE
jgi:hypothetical protein